MPATRRTLRLELEHWNYKSPFRITGHVWTAIEVLTVTLAEDGAFGRGEAAGVHYLGDNLQTMIAQIEAVRSCIEAGADRSAVQALLPPGGARNAIDCALWDLDAKISDVPAWRLAGLDAPRPLITTFTCGADSPQKMAQAAVTHKGAKALKLKLTGDPADADRVRSVRDARPDVSILVDANQGFTLASLERLMPVFTAARVELIEQPFPIGQDSLLDKFESPIPIAADESVQSGSDIAGLVGRFDVINIKLDKCGGLTEALAMARTAHSLGLEAMVGTMGGTSLAMAPGHLVGQLCRIVDLDGPILLKRDREPSFDYGSGELQCPAGLWG